MRCVVKPHFLLTDPLQIGKERRILDHAMKGQIKLKGGGFWRGELLGAGNGVFKDEVHSLTGTLNHAATLKNFG